MFPFVTLFLIFQMKITTPCVLVVNSGCPLLFFFFFLPIFFFKCIVFLFSIDYSLQFTSLLFLFHLSLLLMTGTYFLCLFINLNLFL